ncbi:MAG: 2-C-methyl-D-erythritol 4-phosphate cytidylyltransferase [Candidatus Omnitrophota bacterium]|jgi:2-C-methyl-D-erythritol 4-phosphate cytidylyltransferase
MFITAILLAGGKGKRLLSPISKALVKIGTQPLIVYSLQALSRYPAIKEIIVVVNSGNEKSISGIIKAYEIKKVKGIVRGGLRRQDSLGCGLKALDSRTELVLIHDAARPFLDKKIISSAIKGALSSGASAAAVPVKATIKIANGKLVKKTLERGKLWEVQTPQVFRRNIIVRAYKRFGKMDVTDDASLVEEMGKRVRLTAGSYSNIKVTTPEDMVLAKAIGKEKWNTG